MGRFSEDLDIRIEGPGLPRVRSWTSEGARATEERETFFRALAPRLSVQGAEVEELAELRDRSWRSAIFAVRYESRASGGLPAGIRPFVQLEAGSARVAPAEDRAISSWVHDYVIQESKAVAAGLADNRPAAVSCLRPEVTLLEKIEAIARRYARDPFEPASFVRHYEDVARILAGDATAPPAELRELLEDMKESRDIRAWPGHDDPCWSPQTDTDRWTRLEEAWVAAGPLFWGERIPLVNCAREIRRLLRILAR
ncbi:MAG: nucleotidyl transferase AbiEii/AbiGii toxin family protein [Gemmatimonadota bacterium]|nr:nucleotidyl transferase AbiEii/AbiGii toxin family protein [Gemmatimonadota bacterium]